ncbi:MAG: chemotaxis protein CheD [Planctomycetes bacterium]|nr:chemotaxis protein CheD [Planctomycetota bacterium]
MSESRLKQVPIGGIEVASKIGVLSTLLGSCVGMIVQDMRRHIAVLAHVVRPHGVGAGMGPGYFANLAAPRARDLAIQAGAGPRDLVVRIAGGASMFESSDSIGLRNAEAIKEATYELGMTYGGRIKGPEVGGCLLAVDAATGRAVVKGIQSGVVDEDAWHRMCADLGPRQ